MKLHFGKIQIFSVIFLLMISVSWLNGQEKEIIINAENLPLNQLLIQLRQNNGFQLSFSDNETSNYRITLSKKFSSKEEALIEVLRGHPFKLTRSGDVYIIIPDRKKMRDEKRQQQTTISGQVVESVSNEPLPYSSILINRKQIFSDGSGSFHFTASADSSLHLQISHLGYYIYDTLLTSGVSKKFELLPSFQKISEVTVQSRSVEKSSQIGDMPGNIKLNNNIARFIPGVGDNTVYNLLRLMPGVLAAGENSSDLQIWGSYEGQSQVTFDGFTLFGLKNYNDNINSINPFMVKNIDIYKGGYQARIGNRVGGVVNITGKNGNLHKKALTLSINPTTVNGMAEIPFNGKTSLLAAYRQTYYNLYNLNDFNIFAPTRPASKSSTPFNNKIIPSPDLSIYPDDYRFRDMNLKLTHSFSAKNQLFLSSYFGSDHFELTANSQINRPFQKTWPNGGNQQNTVFTLALLSQEKNRQQGFSGWLNTVWKNGNNSRFIFSNSGYLKNVWDNISVKNQFQAQFNNDILEIRNEALENSFRNENIIQLKNGHQMEAGGGFFVQKASIENWNTYRDTISVKLKNEYQSKSGYLYFQDNLPAGDKVILNSGIRISKTDASKKILFEPRVSLSYKLTESLKWNSAWGMYNQFMFKIANVDRDQNYTYLWVTSTNNIKPLHAMHWITGFNYTYNEFTIDVEGYYKKTENLIRRFFEDRGVGAKRISGFFPWFGDAKAYGLDAYIRRDFGNNTVWASYSLGKVIERLAPELKPLPEYVPAPHDQHHEFKIASIFNIKRFCFSANYVYGSGIEILKTNIANRNGKSSYSRFDVGGIWKFGVRKISGETGFSILNLFDTQNLKQNNLKLINVSKEIGNIRIYTDAVPFTPVVFLKIQL